VLFNRVFALFHPDYTVGSGIAPDLLTLNKSLYSDARGLKEFPLHTAGGESHPAPRTTSRIITRRMSLTDS